MTRILALTLGLLVFTLPAFAQEPDAAPDPFALRYGLTVNLDYYPQNTPDLAIKSLVRAVENKRLDYLMAHLADPKFVDNRVGEYRASFPSGSIGAKNFLAFDRLVRETNDHFLDDPQLLRELRQFARDVNFEVSEGVAAGTAKAVPARKIFLREYGQRWFLDNRQQ